MNWRTINPILIRSEEAANVHATIRKDQGPQYEVIVWREWPEDVSRVSEVACDTLDDAKAAALDLMRAEVVRARGEAENVICDASRWLRANGGEP